MSGRLAQAKWSVSGIELAWHVRTKSGKSNLAIISHQFLPDLAIISHYRDGVMRGCEILT